VSVAVVAVVGSFQFHDVFPVTRVRSWYLTASGWNHTKLSRRSPGVTVTAGVNAVRSTDTGFPPGDGTVVVVATAVVVVVPSSGTVVLVVVSTGCKSVGSSACSADAFALCIPTTPTATDAASRMLRTTGRFGAAPEEG
jgi:hypothetical protein